MADDGDWQKVDIPYKTALVGFHAEARSGEPLSLPDDPREPIFVRTKDGDLWSADSFLGFFFKKTKTEIEDYAPPSLLTNEKETVDFPVNVDPPGTFHVETDTGQVDISQVIVRVEFQRIKH